MRKGRDGEKTQLTAQTPTAGTPDSRAKMITIVATNVVASQPNGTPTELQKDYFCPVS